MFLKFGDDISTIDIGLDGKPIRNRWQWSWLSEVSIDGFSYEKWCKKINKSGACFCTACGKTILYGTSGKKDLRNHCDLELHRKAVKSLIQSTKLTGSSSTTLFTKDSLQDKTAEIKAILSLFIAEHSLPFSLVPDLLKLSQRLSKDVTALNRVTLSHQSATYITSLGVGHSIREEMKEKLKAFLSPAERKSKKILHDIFQKYEIGDNLGKQIKELLKVREDNKAREGYLETAKALMKLPLLNKTITELSYLLSALFLNEHLQSSLKSLAAHLPNVVDPSELGCLDMELKCYQQDTTLAELNVSEEDSNFTLDTD
ncbi:hypothetical protein BgiMline_034223 [Biomphalaria glabrata]|nr:hypothetical protein BgiMline_020407 [Biomphalaria glabrata]